MTPNLVQAADQQSNSEGADYTLRIATGLVELSPEHIVSTTLYNGQFPGPLVRLTEGKWVVVDIYNDTDTAEQLHWHGQFVPTEVDGAAEEGTPYIPAHGTRRIAFVPKPSGFRFYPTHVVPRNNLNLGTYTGQAGPVYIEPAKNPGAYDREVFLVLKEFLPSFSRVATWRWISLLALPSKSCRLTEQDGRKWRTVVLVGEAQPSLRGSFGYLSAHRFDFRQGCGQTQGNIAQAGKQRPRRRQRAGRRDHCRGYRGSSHQFF